MTEDEEHTLPYLQGKVEALQTLLDTLIEHMPTIVLYDLHRTATRSSKETTEKLDADTTHRSWLFARQSHNLLAKIPDITLRGQGALNIYETVIDWMEMRISERSDEDHPGTIAATPQAIASFATTLQYHKDEGLPFP